MRCHRIPLAAATVAAVLAPAARAAPPPTIRTGGPSAAADAKRAVVLGSRALAGKRFTVTDAAGTVVLRGRLSRAPGRAAPWRSAAIADLTAVTAPGSYRVRAAGLRSRPWVVDDGAGTRAALRHILRFYAVNSDGAEPSPVHGPSHLNDATIVGGSLDGQHADLTGGWMDAGDTLKFTGTTSYTVVALLLAARLDAADAPALRATAGVGVRWLLRAHPAADVFVSQVGEIESDHDRDPASGFDPAADDRSGNPRISHRQALTGIGTDSGGRTAAALALAAQSEPDPALRDRLIAEARAWYAAGEQANKLAPRLPEDPYPSGSGNDDMALGAAELYRATGEPQDLADALDWLNGLDGTGSTYWDEVQLLAAAELCGVLGVPAPSPDASARGCGLLRTGASAAARRARRYALGTPGVLDFGTTATHGGSGAVLALAGDRARAADARDWVLGRNAWGKSFVAGLGPGAPRHIHHWAVRKGRSAFAGAVVGGPTTRAILRDQRLPFRAGPFDGPGGVYEDRTPDYVTSEVALDYAASTVLLLAAVGPR